MQSTIRVLNPEPMAPSLPTRSSQQPPRYRLVDQHGQPHLELADLGHRQGFQRLPPGRCQGGEGRRLALLALVAATLVLGEGRQVAEPLLDK